MKRSQGRAETLYNRPVSSVVDYFIVNLGASPGRIYIESGGRLQYKLKAKVEDNEEAIKNGVEFEPITAERMFATLKARHYEPAGKPITRITKQLGNLNDVIWKALGSGVRTPDGFWDWLGGKRRELEILGRILTNREMIGYFRGSNIVNNHKHNNVIAHHCLSIECIESVESSEPEFFQDELASELRGVDEFLNTGTHGRNSGHRIFTMPQKQIGGT